MSDSQEARLESALEGRYTVERKLGEGGMATVYLAKDLKHNRHVALKVLKPELAAVVGAERFLAEIETTANLQHPHILPLFDSGEADGFLFYVMPYIEGETLADRITREAQLPVDEALGIATSVASALQVAHDAGIVHRDIKPANILLSRGEPLVADFGIALALGAGDGTRLTETGLSVGTPYYMSPEQATGDQVIGPAADTYALACVLFEMLVGEPPYLGNTAQAVLGKIIQGVPVSATAARKSVPANVDAAIRRALEKLPADRFTRTADFGSALSDRAFRHGTDEHTVASADARHWKVAAIAAGVAAVGSLAAGLGGLVGPAAPDAPVLRQRLEVPSAGANVRWGLMMALAPDGSGMVYLDEDEQGNRAMYYKARHESVGTPIPGTEDINGIVFAPDGQRVAFLRAGELITRPVRGGAATTLASDTDRGVPGLDWLQDGTIIYEIAEGDQLGRIREDGSAPADTIVRLGSMRWAHGIEGDESALVLRCPGCDLGIVDYASGDVDWVLNEIARAWYVPTGHIIYVGADGAVFATPYDPATRELAAIGTPLFEGVRTGNGWADMVIGDDGTMIYVTGQGSGGAGEVLVWVDRQGNSEPVDPTEPGQDLAPGWLSPDERHVALGINPPNGGTDIWVDELPDGPRTRLTPGDGGYYRHPMWSRDGRSLLYANLKREGGGRWLRVRADGSSVEPEVLFESNSDNFAFPQLTPDGTGIVFANFESGDRDIGYFEFGTDSLSMLLSTDFDEVAPTISPDGRWLAYTSNRTGQPEVFVRPYPDVSSGRTQVSNGGGSEPVWAKSGGEIFYRSVDDQLVAAAYRADSAFVVESRTDLFEMGDQYIRRLAGRSYDVDAAGERFLAVQYAGFASSDDDVRRVHMVLVQNWFEELRERLGEGH